MQKQNYEDLLFSKYNIRTDLALESHQAVIEREGPPELPGVKVQTEEEAGITVTRIVVENDIGARMMGKAPGNYCTIQSSGLREHNRDLHEKRPNFWPRKSNGFSNKRSLALRTPFWWWA